MRSAFVVAGDEWRFWWRSRLAVAAVLFALALTVTALIANASRVQAEQASRESLQTVAEETFKNQPARHPHRMVHYGHYVFRSPAPLAIVDPGVDPYTGTVMYLEGHRQNSATFAPRVSAAVAGTFAELTPAMSYQVLMPLVLILVGFASLSREREGGTDQQVLTAGVAPSHLWLGKVLALFGLSMLLLLPLAAIAARAAFEGEGVPVVGAYVIGYALYLLVWALLVATASVSAKQTSSSLLTLIAAWLALCILAPRLVASVADTAAPMASQIERDLNVAEALRQKGDGHNAKDPAFDRLRANLFEQYGVQRVEDLPVNFQGIVAGAAEADLTATMNAFAESHMATERRQSSLQRALSFLSPQLAVRHFSMALAGTDISQHHRFYREAEAARFDFVQDLNRLHAEKLAYADDINRSGDPEVEKRKRVSPENWRILESFRFEPEPPGQRIIAGAPFAGVLVMWMLGCAALGIVRARRMSGASGG